MVCPSCLPPPPPRSPLVCRLRWRASRIGPGWEGVSIIIECVSGLIFFDYHQNQHLLWSLCQHQQYFPGQGPGWLKMHNYRESQHHESPKNFTSLESKQQDYQGIIKVSRRKPTVASLKTSEGGLHVWRVPRPLQQFTNLWQLSEHSNYLRWYHGVRWY